jgi:hypothetical protein
LELIFGLKMEETISCIGSARRHEYLGRLGDFSIAVPGKIKEPSGKVCLRSEVKRIETWSLGFVEIGKETATTGTFGHCLDDKFLGYSLPDLSYAPVY